MTMPTPTPMLETRWLMTLRGQITAPVVVPPMHVFNVEAASITSPRINAKAVSPSGDWVRIQANGNWKLDVRLMFLTDDGEHIYCHYNGVLRMDPGLGARLASGETIPGSDIYFRSAPFFETASKKYAWLNDILAIGKITRFGGGEVVYEIFEVL